MKHLITIHLIILIFFSLVIQAQTYTNKTEVISAGGGESTGSNYTNFGVIGETFVGYPFTGGNYETSIGFLYNADGIPVDIPIICIDNNIKSFPNPTNGILNVDSGNTTIHSIEVCNLFGVIVHERKYINSIDISQLPIGLYLLRVIDKNGTLLHLEKIIKK